MNKPVITIFAGTNGAGKSTIGTIIDPDAIAKLLNRTNPRSADLPNWAKEAVNILNQNKLGFACQ